MIRDPRRPRGASPRHAAALSRRRRVGSRGSRRHHGSAPPNSPGLIRHATVKRQRRHTILVSLLAVAMFFSSGVAWAYRDLDTNIETRSEERRVGKGWGGRGGQEVEERTSRRRDGRGEHEGR